MIQAWERLGYYRDVHYVIGKRPPKHFYKAYQPPERFENVITFWNGTTVVLGSFDRPNLMRGGNYDWAICDEAFLIKRDRYDEVVKYTLRGSDIRLRDKAGHLSEQFTSSMPFAGLGEWLFEFEELALKEPDNCYYAEGTSWHNRVILTDKVLNRWAKKPDLKYQIEVLNKRIKNLGSLFYPALHDQHWYDGDYNYSYIDDIGIRFGGEGDNLSKKDCRWDKDHHKGLPLNISHDWGGFNCITVDQYDKARHHVRFINAMYVVHPKIIDDLAKDFAEYYRFNERKLIYQWGDRTGNNKQANAKSSYFEQFAKVLRSKGWTVIRQKTGDVEHLERHRFIAKLHRGANPVLPTVSHNAMNCADLRIALQLAPMRDGKKDKASEKPTSRTDPWHATHYTDAYDYRLYHAFSHLDRSRIYTDKVGFSRSA